jgi:thymidylate synthase ThyX
MFSAKVLCDSVSPVNVRLTTVEVTLPRIVLAELNTHRVFSRNSASSRAIPVSKTVERISSDPFIPEYWGKNQKGMQAYEELSSLQQLEAENVWMHAKKDMIKAAETLISIGVHKQITNRLLEPFMWQTVIITATEWSNFFALRRSPEAQPEIKKAADMMFSVIESSVPSELTFSEWHMPLLDDISDLKKSFTEEQLKQISVGRCARVSYLTHDGKRDPNADIELCERLQTSGHMSPFEHVAKPAHLKSEFYGNFKGWIQYRKTLENEDDFSKTKKVENE